MTEDVSESPEHPAALAGWEAWYVCKHCPAWCVELVDVGPDDQPYSEP